MAEDVCGDGSDKLFLADQLTFTNCFDSAWSSKLSGIEGTVKNLFEALGKHSNLYSRRDSRSSTHF